MDLTLGPDQEAIRDAVRDLLGERAPLSRVRVVMSAEPCVDVALWREAAGLGWFGLGLPEAAGGAGYSLPEEMVLFTELGRSLVPGPWLGTVLAAHALPDGALRAGVLGGGLRVAVVDDPGEGLGGRARLDGTAGRVADAPAADAFLVVGGASVRWIAGDARGVSRSAVTSLDPARPLADVRFAAAEATSLAADATALRRIATVLAAAEAVGVAERTLEASVEYAKVRQQFGRPIGSFQAVKHRCADMATRAEVARAATTWAAVAVRDGLDDAARQVHVAKALAVGAAIANASDNVQNHGGMGYTWEGDAHLYLKRAWLLEHAFGSRTAHLDALAAPWRAA